MILEKLRIENFRSFKDETIEFGRYTSLVGPNGCGKSTVLTALNVFFRNTASAPTNMVSLGKEDFHHCDTTTPVKITLTFTDLSEDAKVDLKHYVRQDRLVVSAKAAWDDETQSAEVMQYGSRLVMEEFSPFFAAIEKKEKAPKLAELYKGLQGQFTELPAATSTDGRAENLHAFEEAHPEKCKLLEATAQFFGFTRGSNLLTKYIQWVYVPAVKDASTEQEETSKTALGQLLERTTRQKVNFKEDIAALRSELEDKYKQLVAKQDAALTQLQESIEKRLRYWSTPGANLKLGWYYDPGKSLVVNEPAARASIGEGTFMGEVARLGHGLQRSFFVSLLHELAAIGGVEGPTLLLGMEEPELYQHPPQAQQMATVLEELACEKHNSQVVVSTHSPYFVSSKGFENVRLVRKVPDTNASRVAWTTYVKIEALVSAALKEKPNVPSVTMAKIEQIMQPSQREIFFTRVAVLVEGIEDVAFIGTHLHLRNKWDEFRRHGCHFVVADGKTNLSRLLAIANELKIPAFVIFDGDNDDDEKERQKRDNSCLLRLCGLVEFDGLPAKTLYGVNHVVWWYIFTAKDEDGYGTDAICAPKHTVDDAWAAAAEEVARRELSG